MCACVARAAPNRRLSSGCFAPVPTRVSARWRALLRPDIGFTRQLAQLQGGVEPEFQYLALPFIMAIDLTTILAMRLTGKTGGSAGRLADAPLNTLGHDALRFEGTRMVCKEAPLQP